MGKKQKPGVWRDSILGNKRGKPTKYEGRKTCERFLKFFQDILDDIDPPERIRTKMGQVTHVQRPVDMPTLAACSNRLGITRDVFYDWAETYPEFAGVMKQAKDIQEEVLTAMATRGGFVASPTIFAMKNLLHWTDRVDNTYRGAVNLHFDEQDEEA